MYEVFSENLYDIAKYGQVYKSKNDKHQILVLEIFLTDEEYYNVFLYITTKRKQGYQHLKITGKDGLKSLYWAEQCIIDFIKNKYYFKNKQLRVYGADERRRKIYERSLLKMGFKVSKDKDKYLYINL